jgi:RNA polymerase sigma factor (sigma-70 family)
LRRRKVIVIVKSAEVDQGGRVSSVEEVRQEFAAFYRERYKSTARLAYALTWSPETAEEIAQEAFIRCHARFDELDNPPAFLRVVTVNLCKTWSRRKITGPRGVPLNENALADATSSGSEFLEDIVGALPFRQRAVIVLRYWGGWSERDIAEAIGCKPGTVKSLASRALATLREGVEQ